MGEDSDRFRRRARQCRDLALRARDPEVRLELIQIAGELEEEAARIDAEERDKLKSGETEES